MRINLSMAATTCAVLSTLASSAAFAQGAALGSDTLNGAAPYGTPIADDRLYGHAIFNQLEGRIGNSAYGRWSGQAWIGNDYNKLWLKTEGRYNAERKSKFGDGDHELLYDRPINQFFNLQAGLRYDGDSKPGRTWAVFGVQGLAAGFWNVEASFYASGGTRFALKTNASYDYRFTQRLILQPQIETNWYSRGEEARGVGGGLSDIDSGLRLRYEISRKFASYIGVTYQRFFGPTATFREADGSSRNDWRAVVGVRAWF